MKTLVLYYSKTGNTKFVAELIAKESEADIEEVKETKNRNGVIGYITAGRDAMRKKAGEINPLKKKIEDYDTIFIGQPVWGWTMVPAIRGLTKQHDFTGKNIALFCTLDGSGDKGCFTETRKGLLKSNILGQKAFLKPKKDEKKIGIDVKEFISSLDHTP